MSRVSRRLVATVVAAATILMLTTSAVAAADPDSVRSSASLGARSHLAEHGRLQLQHGGGLQPPPTDVEAASLPMTPIGSGGGALQGTWILVFVGGALASLRYMTRRARL
jgi:hypothetical protein